MCSCGAGGLEEHRGGRRGRRGSAMTESRRGWSCVPTVSHSRLSCESAQLRNLSVCRTTSLARRWRAGWQDGLFLAPLTTAGGAEVRRRAGVIAQLMQVYCLRSSTTYPRLQYALSPALVGSLGVRTGAHTAHQIRTSHVLTTRPRHRPRLRGEGAEMRLFNPGAELGNVDK